MSGRVVRFGVELYLNFELGVLGLRVRELVAHAREIRSQLVLCFILFRFARNGREKSGERWKVGRGQREGVRGRGE
eukprot:1804419-Rhodomonas_salina.1